MRYDLDRAEFQAFKTALLDYLQRFVDEVARHMPQLAQALQHVEPRVPVLCARANVGQRLLGVEGEAARRAPGLDPADWDGLHAWFVGRRGGTPTPPACGGWRQRRCGRCWSTCVASPQGVVRNRAATATC